MAELIWEGKYLDPERRHKAGPLRLTLPFQTVETINESAQDRQKALDLFAHGYDSEWRNRLIWGDKKYVLPSLLAEFAGKVSLIYIDPPFNTGGNFSYSRTIPETVHAFIKEPNAIEQKAYRDTWGFGLDSYLRWFSETVVVLRDLLAEGGSLYCHLDVNVGHYAKVVLDEVFGTACFRNEIIWKRTTARSDSATFNHIHDSIFLYTKSERWTWNQQHTEYTDEYLQSNFKPDAKGRLYRETPLTAPGKRAGLSGQAWRGVDPNTIGKGRHWAIPGFVRPFLTVESQANPHAALDELVRIGRITWARGGEGRPNVVQYIDELEGVQLQSIWTDFGAVPGNAPESLNYPTQKPEALLDRIIKTSSNADDLVLDCFCGSGTTAAVCEKLGRRWITCDLGRFAIQTTRKRLLAIKDVRPFVVQNLGKYERQAWQAQEFGADAEEKLKAYRAFILKLYNARAMEGKTWLHGVKAGRLVHVGSVDSPISVGDVQQIAKEFRQSIGTGADAPTSGGVDVLGWDFAFDLNETAKLTAKQAGVDIRFVVIPREVLEKKAVEQGDIHFYELAALSVDARVSNHKLEIELTDFMMNLDDVPQDVQNAVQHWSQWIDYWAVDFDFKRDTFHNQWQSYRTRKEPKLTLRTGHTYPAAGTYTVMVKVIDILGNDTTKTVKIEVL